jgi:hypothetical protein
VRNNVVYDYGGIASGMTGDRLRANYVGNYVRPGPSSNTERGIIVLTDTADVGYHVAGNVVEGRPALTADNRLLFDRVETGGRRLVTLADVPFEAPPVHATDAAQALEEVLAGVGATRPRRDVVDARVVREVESRTGRVIDSQRDVGGWPAYGSGPVPADADADGMPDEWERSRGLDPADPADGARAGRDACTNLEVYLNGLAGPVPPEGP